MTQKIAFISHPHHRGGVTSWMVLAANECVKRGIETFFVVPEPNCDFLSGGNRPTMHSLMSGINGIKLISKKVGIGFDLGTEEYKVSVYDSLLKQIPDQTALISSDDELVWRASSYHLSRLLFIGVLHSDDIHYYQLFEKFKNFVSSFVSVSERVKKNAGLCSVQHAVIPCGIDLSLFQNETNSRRNQIAWVGRVEEFQKRVSDLTKIVHLLKSKSLDFKLVIIGHGSESEWLENEIKRLGLENYFELLGWQGQEQIKKILSESKLLLQTSNFEGMSVAVMEGLASGCQIVSSRVSGVEDLATDEHAQQVVKLFEIGDVNEAARLIESVLEEKQSFSEQAKALAKKYYAIESCMDKYLEMLKDLKPIKLQSIPKYTFMSSWVFSWALANFRFYKHKIKTRL